MVYLLPKNLQLLFTPGPPIQPLPSAEKKFFPGFSGVAGLMQFFDAPTSSDPAPEPLFAPTWTKSGLRLQRQLRREPQITQRIASQLDACLLPTTRCSPATASTAERHTDMQGTRGRTSTRRKTRTGRFLSGVCQRTLNRRRWNGSLRTLEKSAKRSL